MDTIAVATYRLLAQVTPAPGPSPSPSPSSGSLLPTFGDFTNRCTTSWCKFVLAKTGSQWFADASDVLVVKPLRIILIIVLAILLRRLARRTISRLIRTTSNGSVPAILRPLRERTANPPPETAIPERRRQRAEAIGSVLRSLATALIFSIAVLMVLKELGYDLGPLLASAGIVGLGLGLGAQTLVKDLIAGLFMLLEDQYGVGDFVDLGEASGVIEAVGLRITTLRDSQGVTWYIRNGAITRVGNRSQAWAVIIVDVPVKLTDVEEATGVLRRVAAEMGEDPQWTDVLVDAPEVLGVEQLTADGATLRTQAKSRTESQWRLGREMRRRFTEALAAAQVYQPAGGANGAQVSTVVAAPPNGRQGAATPAGDGSGTPEGRFGSGAPRQHSPNDEEPGRE